MPQARKRISRTCHDRSDHALGYAKLGQLRILQKRLNEAETFYRQALSHEPASVDALQGLVDVDFRRNKPDAALHLLQTAIQQNPNSAQLYLLQGQALAQNKQPADAEKSLEQALQLDKAKCERSRASGSVAGGARRTRPGYIHVSRCHRTFAQ